MSRLFTDDGLLTWEVFASGGDYGLPQKPHLIFHCLSIPERRARFVEQDGDNADAERSVHVGEQLACSLPAGPGHLC